MTYYNENKTVKTDENNKPDEWRIKYNTDNYTRIINDKNDYSAILDYSEKEITATINILITRKNELLEIKKSKNISVRETQKLLTILTKTISEFEQFKTYLTDQYYNTGQTIENNVIKRDMRVLIEELSPEELIMFRKFIHNSGTKIIKNE